MHVIPSALWPWVETVMLTDPPAKELSGAHVAGSQVENLFDGQSGISRENHYHEPLWGA